MSIPYKVIVLPDTQIPFHDGPAMRAVEAYLADERWDEWLQVGDFMDFDQISKFNKNAPRKLEGRTIEDDYKVANALLDRHQALVRKNNPKAKFTLLEGNHDLRIEKLIDEQPQLKGTLEVETNLRLKQRGIKWVKCYSKGELYKLGKAYFHHGLYTSQSHAKKMVDNFGTNIFYGHTHDIQSHSKVQWGKNKTLVGQSLGCLCRYDLDYIKDNPSNWQHSVTTFYFLPDGYFSYYVSRIFNGRFVAPNGKVYTG